MAESEEALAQVLSGFHPIDPQFRLRLGEVCLEQVYPRHYHLLRPGQVARYAWFLVSGSARLYYLHEQKGEEVTVWFWNTGDVMWALGSFCRKRPCQYYLQLLEESRLLAVHRKHLQELAATYPNYLDLERTVSEAAHSQVIRHLHDRSSLSARERFDRLMQRNPRLFLKASVKDIASFLGMFPDTLSRLRARK